MRLAFHALVAAFLCFSSLFAVTSATASAFPEREVMLVVTWAPGGRTDAATRIWAPHLAKQLDVPVVVENKPGAGGIIGARSLLRDKDGYSVGVLSTSHLISQWARIPAFELDKFQPVALLYSSPVVLTVHSSSDIHSLDDFIAATKERTITFGHAGHGSGDHISAAALADMTNIKVRHVPYEGDAGAVTALLNQEIDAVMMPLISVAQQIEAGSLRPIAVSQLEADELHKDVPTFASQGVPFEDGDLAGAILISADAPAEVVSVWENALSEAFKDETLNASLKKFYITPNFRGSENLKQILTAWNARNEPLIEKLGLKVTK